MSSSEQKTVAIIGRPNVGKSTLFNRLTGKRTAIETPIPGTTRDRLFDVVEWRGQKFDLVDVAGVEFTASASRRTEIEKNTQESIDLAIENADLILFLVAWDEKENQADKRIARILRKIKKPILLVVNKADNLERMNSLEEFKRLGNYNLFPVSAISGKGSGELLDEIVKRLPKAEISEKKDEKELKLAIIGRPNVGKSTLINTILGERRAIVSDVPGTTRDVVSNSFFYKGKKIKLLDTAGIRRRGKIVKDTIESFALLRTIRALKDSDIAILLIDAEEGLVANDAHILGLAKEWGKGIILAVNKLDLIKGDKSEFMAKTLSFLQTKLNFVPWIPVVFISAKEETNVKSLLNRIISVEKNRTATLDQNSLDQILESAKNSNSQLYNLLNLSQKRTKPPIFKLLYKKSMPHVSQIRYLENKLRDQFPLEGTPIFIDLFCKNRRDKR